MPGSFGIDQSIISKNRWREYKQDSQGFYKQGILVTMTRVSSIGNSIWDMKQAVSKCGGMLGTYDPLRHPSQGNKFVQPIRKDQLRTGERYQKMRPGCCLFALSRPRIQLVVNEPVNRAMRLYNPITEADNELDINSLIAGQYLWGK